MTGMHALYFATFITVILGSTFTITSFLLNKSLNEKKKRCTYKTIAKIVDIEKRKIRFKSGDIPRISAFNCYEYECNCEKVKVWSNIGNMPGKFQIGQQVTLYCNPYNPNEFYSEEESSKTVITVFKFVGIGVLALAMILTTIILLLVNK